MCSKHPRSSSNDDASPSKKQKELEANEVFVSVQQNYQTVTGDQLVQFLQDTLVGHGLCYGKAITSWFKITQKTYRINVRSSRQAEFLCCFNGLTLKNGQNSSPLTFDRGGRWKPTPKYQSYAEFVEHEGKPMEIAKEVAAPNSKIMAKFVAFLFYFPSCRSIQETVSFLNQVMEEEGLVHKSIDRAILAYHFDTQERYWVLEMANEDVQETIQWLHSVPWSDFGTILVGAGGRDGKPRLEKPRYTSWAAYKIATQSAGEQEVETPPSQTPVNDGATAIREENERLKKELVKLCKNNIRLKGQLSTKRDKETDLKACVNTITTELATAQQQLHDVHQSWQEQVHEISEKDGQISFLTNSIDALQKHV
jgi:hypothetical protein